MKGKNSKNAARKQAGASGAGFRISGGPVVSNHTATPGIGEYSQLPTSYGSPILFAIPRDPRTIFTYWNIDWSDTFARKAPADQQVYLRLKRREGSGEGGESGGPL